MGIRKFVKSTKIWRHHSSYTPVLVVILAFVLMVVLSSHFMTNIVREELTYNAQTALDSLELSIKADLMEPRTVLSNQSETIRAMIQDGGADKEEVRTYLNRFADYILRSDDILTGFLGIFGYFEVFGGVMLDGQNRPAPETFIPTESDWYEAAVAAGGEVAFLHPHTGILAPNTPVITYARALYDDKGNLLGVIALDIQFERVREYVINANLGKLGYGILLNDQLVLIAHVNPELEGKKWVEVNHDTAKVVTELELGHNVSEFKMKNYKGESSVTFVRRLENGWYIAIVTPEDEYFLDVRRLQIIIMGLGIALALVVSVIQVGIIIQKRKADIKASKTEETTKNIRILENILNSLDVMIYVTVPQTGELLFINKYMKNYYKIKEDYAGQLCYKLFRKGLNDRCDFCPCRQLDEEPERIIDWVEFNALTKRTYRNTDCFIEWPGGTLAHLQYSIDITELNDAKERAIEANRVKSNFLAKMSHEIRTPMNVILGIAEIELEKEGLPPDTIKALGKVYNSGYLLLGIINDILDLSKIEAGKLELSPVTYDVASLINDTVQLNIMRFDNKPIQFSLEADENIPSVLFGDDLRIKQILNNILSNAFKYTDSGKVLLSVTADVRGPEEPVTVIFRISDTGHGMSQNQMDKLFDDYARFNINATRTIEGTGLGMSITKHLIDIMKGEITVESELGKGSVFTVRLPQGYVDSGKLGKEGVERMQEAQFGKTLQQNRFSHITREYMPYGKVLIVDDMEPNLYVARGLLIPYGLSIETALSGTEAIGRIKDGVVYDIIFMDHFMPEMDGIEATKIIRSLGYTRPIVALTANALAGQAEMFLENGFDGFISKPIDIRQLNSTLNKLIRDRYPADMVQAARRLKESLEQKISAAKRSLSAIKALVVDDFLPNLNVAAGLLRKKNIQADCAISGQNAIDLIKGGEPKYDIIFMDYLMPEMDGIETVRAIRSLGTEYAKNIPIIALTANTGSTDEEVLDKHQFLDNGFEAVLTKPLSVAKLDLFIKSGILDKIKSNTPDTGKKKEKRMIINIPGVNEKKIMELYDGDLDIFLPVLRSYVSVIPKALEKMGTVSEESLPKYIVSVHGVKSTSESIGAEDARKMAAELEAMAKAGDISGVLAKNETLLSYVNELLGNIQNWLAKYDAE